MKSPNGNARAPVQRTQRGLTTTTTTTMAKVSPGIPGQEDVASISDDPIPLSSFPTSVQRLMAASLDTDGNGFVSPNEMAQMLKSHAELKAANAKRKLAISTLPERIQGSLRAFDVDGDGTLDPTELHRASELYSGT